MAEVRPSDAQLRAITAIKEWFQNRTKDQQVFRLFGYAGVGKSTVLKFALDELGLEPHRGSREGGGCVPGVVTATFTGKAALVLRRKGTPARTIHSLIYSVIEATEAEIEEAKKAIAKAEDDARKLAGFERTAAEAAIEAMRQALTQMKRPRFALNPQSDAAEAKLIVLDEVSMVGEEMARDLMSFGKPILVLGDPGQLPPIKGEGAFTTAEPDIMLTEIHRQAAESAIIRLATLAREGKPIGFGQYDEHVWKMSKMDLAPEQLLRGGQVICGMNATRLQLNNAMRFAAGFTGSFLPTGPADRSDLWLGHHVSSCTGKRLEQRRRVGRWARPQRDGSPPLAIHGDHKSRTGARAAGMIDLNDAWPQVCLFDSGAMSRCAILRIEAGMRVYRWLVLTEVEPVPAHGHRKRRRWFCRCDCGNEKIVLQQSLSIALRTLHAGSRSCGCYQVDRATKHANNAKGRPTSEYMTWIAAKKRCENPRNASYRNYGQRGIRMCAEWSDSFETFLRHMGPKPDPTFSLDRIDPNGHYEPGNCRWASSREQARNKRTNAWYSFRDERMLIGDVAARLGVSRDEARAMERRGTLPARRIGGAANEPVSSLHGDGIDLNDATILSSSFIIVELEYSETVWGRLSRVDRPQ